MTRPYRPRQDLAAGLTGSLIGLITAVNALAAVRLRLAFSAAMAFSPTDVSPIRPWAKLMMMAEEAVSLVVAVLVIARAVNILHLTTSSSRPDRPPSSGGPVRPAAGAVRPSLRAG